MPLNKRLFNKLNTKKKKFVLPPVVAKTVGLLIKLLIVGAIVVFVVITGWQYTYKLVTESYKPNAKLFEACSSTFIHIKTKPTYGVVFKTTDDAVDEMYLTAPEGVSGLKSILLEKKDWVAVYFSQNFTSTQIGEFLRLSRLEKGKVDYCYVLEQISLTSGVPIEFVIVEDSKKGVSATVSIADAQIILDEIEKQSPKKFNRKLLPLLTLDDGSRVVAIIYESFKEQFPTFFELEGVSQEQAFVEVYNSTPIDGYASILSRKWSMLGIDISRIGNAAHEKEGDADAVLYVKNEQLYSRTLAMIKGSFPEGKVVVKQGRPSNVMTTGDIVVFLLKR